MLTFFGESGIHAIANEVCTSDGDVILAYKNAIDNALLEFGTTYEDLSTATVTYEDVNKFNKLLRYFALRVLAETCAIKVDIRTDSPFPEKRSSQLSRQIMALLDDALSQAQAEGYLASIVRGAGQIGYGEFLVDAVEPAETTDT